MKKMLHNKTLIRGVVGLLIFFVIWELSVRLGVVSSNQMSPPTQVMGTFAAKLTDINPDGATIGSHFLTSFSIAFCGFAMACAIGIPLGLLMGYFGWAKAYINPIFEILRPIPPIAWIPIVMLVFGIGMGSKVFIIFVSAVVPCVINSYTGVRRTPVIYQNVGHSLGMSRWRIFTKICVPYALPTVFTGVRLSLNTSWTALVAAELLASTKGLGYMIQMGRVLLKPNIIIVGMLTIGCSGALMSAALTLLEKKITGQGSGTPKSGEAG